jgi:N-methylhydantoinase A
LFGGGGHVVRVPSIDIVEAGAGGGSIAWIDDSGALRVGPRSAGAEPGPVCYGHGGLDPTVTDANVALGYMNPKVIAGSKLAINAAAALDAIAHRLAAPLGLDPMSVAYGITQVANSAMTRVLRAVTTERGRDPREFTMVAFGGAGPLHAALLAENMDITRLIVPVYPGLFSALGLLMADYRHDYIATVAAPLTSVAPAEILARYQELRNTGRAEMIAEGVSSCALRFEQQLDLKYGYQMYEMTLPFPDSVGQADLIGTLARLFTEAHDQTYGYYRDDPIELVSLRLRVLASAGSISFAELATKLAEANAHVSSASSMRQAFFGPAHGMMATHLRNRFDIAEAEHGPIIIEEPDTTIVVPPGWTVQRDAFANLVLTRD